MQPQKYIVESNEYSNEWKTPVLTACKTFILGYTNETSGVYQASEAPIILFDDFTTSSKYVDFNFKVKSSACKILVPNLYICHPLYMYFLLQTLSVNSTTHKRYWIDKFIPMVVRIPSIKTQKMTALIVEVLFKKIDELQKKYDSIEKLKEKIKRKIIQLGLQGRLLNTDDNYYSTKIASISSLLDESFYGDGNWVLSDDMEIDSKLKLIQLGNIGDGSYIDKKLKSVKNKYKTNNDCKYIHNGYLLINRLIANRMYACIFESELNNEYITSVDVCWVKPNKIINLRYLLYIMLSIDTQQQVLQKASGSTRKRISKKNLININFNYFEDLDVQQRIVASIEKTLKLLNY